MNTEFVSIDIETTGLEPSRHGILQVGAVLCRPHEPKQTWPTFCCYPQMTDSVEWSDYCVEMHRELVAKRAASRVRMEPACDVADRFRTWLVCGDIPPKGFVAAGKNFSGFDARFLAYLPGWSELIRPKPRVLDPGPLYWRPEIDGSVLPNLATCLERAGLPSLVTHDAVDDAMQVAELIALKIRQAATQPA